MSDNYPYRRRPADSDLRPEPHRRAPADSDLRPEPHRRAPADSDLRPEPGSYGAPEHRYSSEDHDFYRSSQASSSSQRTSLPPDSRAQWPQEGALNILNSCGLEPGDLTLLAELPEDVLTVESLPHVLKQIKGKRGTVKPFLPTAPPPSSSSPHSSARRPVVAGDRDPLPNRPPQCPVSWMTGPAAAVVCRGSPRSSSSDRADPPSSSSLSSSYMSDLHHRSSDNDRTGRGAGPASTYDYRPRRSDLRKTGASPLSSRDDRPLPSDLGRMGRGAGPASSRGYLQRPSDYGKMGGVSAPVSSQNHISSLAGGSQSFHPSPFPEPAALRPGLPRAPPLTVGGRRENPSPRSSGPADSSLPSMREATDFHGATPPSYPYSCCLCDITVMSERVWIKHVNGPHHADGQLSLLQRFPKWDCRMETVCRAESQSESPDEGTPQMQTVRQSSDPQQRATSQKASDRSKVVCVKFPAQAVDEAHLKKLVQPFGRVVKMLMFPSLAFVELGSVDQAKDLVKFHVNNPPTVNGEQMEFSISTTFSFLQSSRVVSFSPGPSGKTGRSDLMGVVKRFGAPLFTMFLPSTAFVEMKNAPDAHSLVDYYSSQSLRINNHVIQVSFSKEYKSLLRIGMAKKYVEDSDPKQRTRSLSQEKEKRTAEEDDSSRERKTRTRERSSRDQRSRSVSRSKRDKRSRTRSRERSKRDKRSRTRSRERARSKRDKRCRTRSRERSRSKRDRTRSRERARSKRDQRSRTRSRERSSSKRDQRSRTRSTSSDESSSDRSKSRERSSKETRTTSRSTEKSTIEERSKDKLSRDGSPRARSTSTERRSGSKSRSTGVSVEPTESKTDPEPDPSRDSRPAGEELSSAEDSDIEGMEVIGEDGESLLDEDMETLDEAEKEEEEEEEEEEAAEITDLPEEEEEDEVMEGEEEEEECETKQEEESKETDEERSASPEDLETCVALDELEEDQRTDAGEDEDDEPPSCRVVYFGNVPLHRCSDAQFIQLVRSYGRPVGYYLKPPSVGFIEMSSSSEARTVVQQLTGRKQLFFGFKLRVGLSEKYGRLSRRWEIPDEDEKREGRSRNSRRSRTPNRNESDKRLEGSKRSKISPEKSLEKDSSTRKTVEKDSPTRKTVEKDSPSERTPEKAPHEESTSELVRKGPEEDSESRTEKRSPDGSPENKSLVTDQISRTAKESSSNETGLENQTLKRSQTHGTDAVPQTPEAPEELMEGQRDTSGPRMEEPKSPYQPDSTGGPRPQREQKPTSDLRVQHQAEPAGGDAELQPDKPVGTEFVRPVVGYFCNLCQVIYADEDEAKLQHCSSAAHYRKYQEKTGKDPRAM